MLRMIYKINWNSLLYKFTKQLYYWHKCWSHYSKHIFWNQILMDIFFVFFQTHQWITTFTEASFKYNRVFQHVTKVYEMKYFSQKNFLYTGKISCTAVNVIKHKESSPYERTWQMDYTHNMHLHNHCIQLQLNTYNTLSCNIYITLHIITFTSSITAISVIQ